MWSNSDPVSVPLSVTVVPTVKQSDSVYPLHHTSAIQLGSYSQTERSYLSFTPNQCNTTWFLQPNRAILSVLYTKPVQYNLVPTKSDLTPALRQSKQHFIKGTCGRTQTLCLSITPNSVQYVQPGSSIWSDLISVFASPNCFMNGSCGRTE